MTTMTMTMTTATEHHKTIGFSKNNSSAHPAGAFYILIHFFAVLVLTTTWNDQIWGYVADEIREQLTMNFQFSL